MRNPFRTRYRIVTDPYRGYRAQQWSWWYPWWDNIGITEDSVEEAEQWIRWEVFPPRVVKHVEPT